MARIMLLWGMIKRPTRPEFDELINRMKPMDALLLLLIEDDLAKGVNSVVKTRFANNSLTTLSYAGMVMATQKKGEFPVVRTITARGLKFCQYLRSKTSIEQLAMKLPVEFRPPGLTG